MYNGKKYIVKGIGRHAFEWCRNLSSITIPESITYIDKDAFNGCSSLNSVQIDDITAWCNIKFDSHPFSYNSTSDNHLFMNGEEITELILPNSLTNIKAYTFYRCSNLISVTIPESVTNISEYAFAGCWSLTSVTIPNSITNISEYTFSGCSGLESINIPESVTHIGAMSFYNTRIPSVTIGSGVLSIGENAFTDNYGDGPYKVIWFTNTPPKGYENAAGNRNYVPNELYELKHYCPKKFSHKVS